MFRSLWLGSAALALLFSPPAKADDQADTDQPKRAGVHVEVRTAPVQIHGEFLGQPLRPIKLGEYWLGVSCTNPGAALQSHLGLPRGQGLVVGNVVPEGPAAKAGIQVHDVLLTAGDKPLGELPHLIDAIEEAKEAELSLELIRGGKKMKVAVTPAKRPEDARGHGIVPLPRGPGFEWLEKIRPGGPRGLMRYRFFHPGMILPHGAAAHPPLPGNLKINVTRQGNQPAKIVVERDGEKWEITEEELDKLPEDLRPHVSRMLGNVSVDVTTQLRPFDFVPDPLDPDDPQQKPDPYKKHRRRAERQMEKQIGEMNRQMEQLRKMVEEMQKEGD